VRREKHAIVSIASCSRKQPEFILIESLFHEQTHKIRKRLSQQYLAGMGGSVRSPVQAVAGPSGPAARQTASCGPSLDLSALNVLAVRSLASLFDANERLFCRSATRTDVGFLRIKTSRRHTIIALLGLHRLAESGVAQPFDLASIRDVVLAETNWVRGVGDLGLLTWFTAEFAPERLRNLLSEFDFDRALETYVDGPQACTRGLAWFLAGIAHARLANPPTLPDLSDVALATYRLLQDSQGESGVFGHYTCPGFLRRTFCRRFGTFSDQIHSIYALTAFARAFQIEEPLASALGCANSMCALQGELGQWWFLYDKRKCRVASRYPVFSLHQDGTAPVGLLALGEATGQDFGEAIFRGLSWVTGMNELRNDLRSLERGSIWDCVVRKRRTLNYWETALSLVNVSAKPREEQLSIRYEIRPDHFGWLLYAFGRLGLPKLQSASVAADR